MNETSFKCPVCQSPMKSVEGDTINPRNGISIYCDAPICPTFENVYGHGKNVEAAYEVAVQKFGSKGK